MQVDFPLPDVPIMATSSPFSMLNEISFKNMIGAASIPDINIFVKDIFKKEKTSKLTALAFEIKSFNTFNVRFGYELGARLLISILKDIIEKTKEYGTFYSYSTSSGTWDTDTDSDGYALDNQLSIVANNTDTYLYIPQISKWGYELSGLTTGSTNYPLQSSGNCITMPSTSVTLTAMWTTASYAATNIYFYSGSGIFENIC